MGRKERVILIKGDASKWYEQAIFIVNKDISPENMPVNFVAEAESIINNYIMKKKQKAAFITTNSDLLPNQKNLVLQKHLTPQRKESQKRPKKNKRFDFIANSIMALGCLLIFAMLLFGIFQ